MTPTLLKETPSLPLELWDVTITHLREDRGTLSDCSLVCRSWEPMARRHLFETVAVLGPQDRCRLLLCDPSSTVLPYVHKLLLMKRDQPHVAWVEDLLPQVRANDLTALRTLWLSNVRWDGLSAASRTSLIHLCRWLTQIGLISKWPDHDARCPFAVELLGASPSLQRFALRCMHEDNHWQSPAQPLDIAPYSHMSTKAAPHLRTLEISADVGPLLTVLHTVFPVLHLQELSLGPLYEGTGSLVLSFLRSCAETLVCLSLSFKMFNETTYDPAFCAGGGVSCLTALETFSIGAHPKHIPDILRQITSKNLAHLNITVSLRTSAPSDVDDLVGVLTTGSLAVSRPHVALIRSPLDIDMEKRGYNAPSSEDMRDALLAGLQSLHKEGRLQLERFIGDD